MEEWVTHPNNRAAIEAQFEPKRTERQAWDPFYMPLSFIGIPIRYDSNLPERDIEERWHPPADDKFVGYGPEDEAWMRPLRLGRFEYIDKGPLIYKIQLPMFRFRHDFGPLLPPRPLTLWAV